MHMTDLLFSPSLVADNEGRVLELCWGQRALCGRVQGSELEGDLPDVAQLHIGSSLL